MIGQDKHLFSGVHIHANEKDALNEAASDLIVFINDCLRINNACHVVISGGNSVTKMLACIETDGVDWKYVVVSLTDERCVPVGDALRNDRMIRVNLLSQIEQDQPQFLIIPAELGAVAGAEQYATELLLCRPPDVVVLGVGEDGHIASLFDGHSVDESGSCVVAVTNSPKPPKSRISLSLQCLRQASRRMVILTGHTKRDLFVQLYEGAKLPVASFEPTNWYIDIQATDDLICKEPGKPI